MISSYLLEEKALINEKDIFYNKDKFDSKEINLCFITGHSGSGKSTMATNMSTNKIEHYQLDDLIFNWNFSDDNLKEYGDLIYSFFKTSGKQFRVTKEKAINDPNYENIVESFVKYSIKYAYSHKENQYIIEGVQLFQWINPSLLKDFAVYIKGTSRIISAYRASKRDVGYENNNKDKIKILIKRFINDIKYGKGFESKIKKWRLYFSSLQRKTKENIMSEKYDMITNEITNRVQLGYLTQEESNILNKLAYKKYIHNIYK